MDQQSLNPLAYLGAADGPPPCVIAHCTARAAVRVELSWTLTNPPHETRTQTRDYCLTDHLAKQDEFDRSTDQYRVLHTW
jgi:hypothetical protein